MRGYISYFKLQLINALQYRTAALAGIATQFFWGFVLLFIFDAFYKTGNTNQLINFKELVPYIWLNQAFFALIYFMSEKDITESIKNGSVCYELTKPYNLYIFWYIKLLVKKYAAALLRFMPVILISVILPAPYNLTAPYSIISFILFITTLILGTFVITSIVMIVTVFTFYNYSDDGMTDIMLILFRLLSGLFIPVPFLPDFIQKATYYLPFRLIGDLPFRIYTGNIPQGEAIFSVFLQLFWIIVLVLIGYNMFRNAIKKIYIQGG